MSNPSLLAAVQGLDPFLRAHISTIRINTGSSGYQASLSINHYGPVPSDVKEPVEALFPGVTMGGCSRHDNIELTLDWQCPIWEQVEQLIQDPAMSALNELGSMGAQEHSRDEADGTVTKREALKTWVIKTHVKRKDRDAWIAMCMRYSASVWSPSSSSK